MKQIKNRAFYRSSKNNKQTNPFTTKPVRTIQENRHQDETEFLSGSIMVRLRLGQSDLAVIPMTFPHPRICCWLSDWDTAGYVFCFQIKTKKIVLRFFLFMSAWSPKEAIGNQYLKLSQLIMIPQMPKRLNQLHWPGKQADDLQSPNSRLQVPSS